MDTPRSTANGVPEDFNSGNFQKKMIICIETWNSHMQLYHNYLSIYKKF